MRFALHAKCDKEYLTKADEIIVSYKEKERILDYPSLYPDAAVTIQCIDEKSEEIDWKWLKAMKEQFPKGFTVGVKDIESLSFGIQANVPIYWLQSITTFNQLNFLYDLGVSYIYVDQPLFSSVDKLKRFNIPVRWMPNIINQSGFIMEKAHGTWIRPEDLDEYDIIPGCIAEFNNVNGSKAEQAFYRVYALEKEWPMDLGLLLLDFKDKGIANSLIDPDLIEHRLNCHHKCEEYPNRNGCHICLNVFNTANREKIVDYLNTMGLRHD